MVYTNQKTSSQLLKALKGNSDELLHLTRHEGSKQMKKTRLEETAWAPGQQKGSDFLHCFTTCPRARFEILYVLEASRLEHYYGNNNCEA